MKTAVFGIASLLTTGWVVLVLTGCGSSIQDEALKLVGAKQSPRVIFAGHPGLSASAEAGMRKSYVHMSTRLEQRRRQQQVVRELKALGLYRGRRRTRG